MAEPPSESELEFRNSEGAKLVGRMVLYRWPDIGWCKGKIISVNTDGRFKVGGANVNFIIYCTTRWTTTTRSTPSRSQHSGCCSRRPEGGSAGAGEGGG